MNKDTKKKIWDIIASHRQRLEKDQELCIRTRSFIQAGIYDQKLLLLQELEADLSEII